MDVSEAFDGPGAIAVVTAWINGDAETVAAVFAEAAAEDPAAMLFGLAYVASTAIQAYAEAALLPVDDVLALLGTITARRAAEEG
ncbi:MAG: hypothetical protein JWL64_506 [Frankiales bacterium]|nr:hypothetical protein [Frankiales bacterium]